MSIYDLLIFWAVMFVAFNLSAGMLMCLSNRYENYPYLSKMLSFILEGSLFLGVLSLLILMVLGFLKVLVFFMCLFS